MLLSTRRMSLSVALLLLAARTEASVITLLAPVPTETASSPPSTRTKRISYEIEQTASVVSAVGAAPSNGMTKYAEVNYITRVVAHVGTDATLTLLSTPVPVRTCE